MKINIAKSAGFCFGVKRAVDTVYKESSKKNVYIIRARSFTMMKLSQIWKDKGFMSSMTVKISSLFQRERLLFVLTACQKQFMMRSLMRVLI